MSATWGWWSLGLVTLGQVFHFGPIDIGDQIVCNCEDLHTVGSLAASLTSTYQMSVALYSLPYPGPLVTSKDVSRQCQVFPGGQTTIPEILENNSSSFTYILILTGQFWLKYLLVSSTNTSPGIFKIWHPDQCPKAIYIMIHPISKRYLPSFLYFKISLQK